MVKVEVYQTRKVNRVDILDSIDRIREECNLITEFDDVTLLTADENEFVDIDELDNEEIVKCSMVVMEDDDDVEMAYFITNYKKISPTTYRLFLKRASLTTILDSSYIVEAFADRMHVTKEEDNTLYFTALEPFKPCERPYSFDDIMDKRFPTNNTVDILETLTVPPQLFITKTNANNVGDSGMEVQEVPQMLVDSSIDATYYVTHDSISSSPNGHIVKQEDRTLQLSITESDQPIMRKLIPTQLSLSDLNGGYVNIDVGTRWWLKQDIQNIKTHSASNVNDKLKKSSVINDLRNLGYDKNITAYWAIPSPYVAGSSHSGYNATEAESYGGVNNITASMLKMDWEFRTAGALVKNNKCKYAQCMTLTVYNPASGASLTKQPFEISNPTNKPSEENIKAAFYITADLRASGSPIFKWKWRNAVNESSIPNGNSELVLGSPWRQLTVASEGISGEYWNQRAINKANERADRQFGNTMMRTGLTVAGTIIGSIAAPGPGTAAGGAAGSALGNVLGDIGQAGAALGDRYYNQAYEIRQMQELLNAQGQIAEPVTQFTGSNYSREIGLNTFVCQYTYWSEKDVQQFDRFLTMYGYKVENKRFETSDFKSRPHFNYVKLNSVILNNDKYSKAIIDEAIEELKQGVRIWHELPNDAAIEDGNKEG